MQLFSGESSCSIASVSVMGDVVYVSRDEPQIRQIILAIITPVVRSPSSVIFIFHIETSATPSIKKRLSIDVNRIIGRIGFRLFSMSFIGILERRNSRIRKTNPRRSPQKLLVQKSIAI